jgi:hypothetical protein
VPRYADEPEEQRRKPIWSSDMNQAPKLDLERDQEMMDKIAQAIQKQMNVLETHP